MKRHRSVPNWTDPRQRRFHQNRRHLLRRDDRRRLLVRSWPRSPGVRPNRIYFSYSISLRVLFYILINTYRRPPAISSVSPVIHFESSEAKNTAAGAISSG